MALPPQPVQPPAPANPGVQVTTFSGLKNTVDPVDLTARELSRAQNVDLDDLGRASRRRGRTLRVPGRWHSLFTTTGLMTFGVKDGGLVLVLSNFALVHMLEGISDAPLAWVEVGQWLYATSITNSFKIYLPELKIYPWGRVVDHAYQPGLEAGPADFWHSPVVNPDEDPEIALGPVQGKLLGAPPLGGHACAFNGRIYVAAGPDLWTTELYSYDYVDRTAGYRQYEAQITGLVALDDGYYVGTRDGVYYVTGRYGEEQRSLKTASGVVEGSMIQVPGEMVDPEGRRFPDLPRQTQPGMWCMTSDGAVVGLNGGQTFNLTRTQFRFPGARRAAAMFRQQDGAHTVVATLKASGDPTDDGAKFGDRLEAKLIRATTPGQPGSR